MRQMLDDLNRVPGVAGSLVCDREGTVLAEACPPDVGGAALLQAAKALAAEVAALQEVTGPLGLIELHHGRKRLMARPITAGVLLLCCEKDASPRKLVGAVAEVLERHGQVAPAPPPPASHAHAPARRPADAAGIPRRTLILGGAIAVTLLAAIAVYGIVAAPPGAPLPARAPAASDARVLLRIGGGKSFAAELAPNLAKAYLESANVKDVAIVRESATRTTVRGRDEAGALVGVVVDGMPTAKGFDALAANQLDVAMAGRRIKAEWAEKLSAFGNMTAPGFEHVVALSGIAVIVHPSNPVARLDRAQLAAIFSGATTDWSRVGGGSGAIPGAEIHVYAGDEQMGITDLFRTLVLGKSDYASGAKRLPTISGVNDAVAQDPSGIGYVTLPFVKGTRAVAIAEGREHPHLPTAFTLASEDYFLTHRAYFYAVPRPENPHLLRFIQFALGAEGQAVVKRSGFVELSVATTGDAVPSWAPADYRRLVTGAKKLTSTFRFETDSANFDTRALVDLERVTGYLVEARLSGAAVKVLGFTDDQGKTERNLELSRARAELVKEAFAQRGIDGVTVAGFGPAMPVASNDSEEGRRRNRRVEVWVER